MEFIQFAGVCKNSGARLARGPRRRSTPVVRALSCGLVGVVLIASLARIEAAGPFRATVTWVDDGDTVWTLNGASRARVRLQGVDCPELGQPYGLEAKQFMTAALLRREVAVDVRDVDAYGRLIARVTQDGRDVSETLLSDGLAWYYARYSPDPVLATAERDAKAAHRGLWSQPHPEPPWEYRARTQAAESPSARATTGAGADSVATVPRLASVTKRAAGSSSRTAPASIASAKRVVTPAPKSSKRPTIRAGTRVVAAWAPAKTRVPAF